MLCVQRGFPNSSLVFEEVQSDMIVHMISFGGKYLDVTFCLLIRTHEYGLYLMLHFLVLFSGMSLYAVILCCHYTLYFLVCQHAVFSCMSASCIFLSSRCIFCQHGVIILSARCIFFCLSARCIFLCVSPLYFLCQHVIFSCMSARCIFLYVSTLYFLVCQHAVFSYMSARCIFLYVSTLYCLACVFYAVIDNNLPLNMLKHS